MPTPQSQPIIPPASLTRGPDAIRGSGYAFIYTKYADPRGNHWFIQPGHVGHETMTNTPGMLQALFGPKAKEVAEEVVELRDVYCNDSKGFSAPTGEKKEVYDYQTIRRLAKRENLFGRAGVLNYRNVVMLWGAPENWQAMLAEVLKLLNVTPNTVITVGTDQFLASDFLEHDEDGKRSLGARVDADQKNNKERLELQAQYHIATGAKKETLENYSG
jgi:hypothetical protein